MSEKLDFREGAFGFYYQPNYGKWLVIKLVINECLQERSILDTPKFQRNYDKLISIFPNKNSKILT